MSGRIIAFVGPSGAGKNFVKTAVKRIFPHVVELTVFTTRARRPCDGLDRKTDIPVEEFLKMKKGGKIIAAHQPFGFKGHWYGFLKEQINELLRRNEIILTEINVDNIKLFKRLYGDKIYLLAITAENEYLKHNLQLRDSEQIIDITVRLKSAIREINIIKKMKKKKLINRIINANWNNRDKLGRLVIDDLRKEINTSIKKENKTELR